MRGEVFFSLLRRLTDLGICLLIVALAGALGTRILPKLDGPRLSRLAIRAGLGLGITALSVLAVGSFWSLAAFPYWIMIVSALIALRRWLVIWFQDMAAIKSDWRYGRGMQRWLMAFIAFIFVSTLIVSLVPPLKFDALVYHLALPQQYWEAGRIQYMEANVLWGFPQIPHMLYTLALTLGAQQVAVLGWAMGLLAVLGLSGHFADRFGDQLGWVAPAVLLSGTSLAASLAWGYVDWPSILFGWMTLYGLDRYLQKEELTWAILAGLGSGLALGSKYPAGLLLVSGAATLLLLGRKKAKALLSFLAAAGLVALPWALRNLLATGNGIYPMLFSGGVMDAFRLQATQALPAQGNWLDLLLLPFRAVLFGLESGRVGGAPGYEADLGIAILAFALFAWLDRQRLPAGELTSLRLLALFSMMTIVVWVVAARLSGHLVRTHLYYFAFPAFAGLAVLGFRNVSHLFKNRMPEIFLTGCLVLSGLSVMVNVIQSEALATFLDQSVEQDYLEENLGWLAIASRYVRDELPADSRVLMLWEGRSFYCGSKCDPDEILDAWRDANFRKTSSQSIGDYWVEQGYSHLLYFQPAAQFVAQDPEHFLPLELYGLETALANLTKLRDFGGAYILYEIAP